MDWLLHKKLIIKKCFLSWSSEGKHRGYLDSDLFDYVCGSEINSALSLKSCELLLILILLHCAASHAERRGSSRLGYRSMLMAF